VPTWALLTYPVQRKRRLEEDADSVAKKRRVTALETGVAVIKTEMALFAPGGGRKKAGEVKAAYDRIMAIIEKLDETK
jgi:hypothetical protein